FQGLHDIPGLGHVVSPTEITAAAFVILVGLFLVQARGTASVAKMFGPVMVVWFVVIGGIGAVHLLDDPGVLLALSPHFAVEFM
ncbi:KUP/HAK/KT family potassium transporter, partial [Acinetobacter baumannii]